MVDLEKFVGMKLKLDEEKAKLVFDKDPSAIEPAVRTIAQMKEVLADESVSKPEELYYMYRDIHQSSDTDTIKKYKLRFDITIIKPEKLDKEFMKTAGHYHPGNYPELYEVVYGEALCLQQRFARNDPKKIEEVIVVKAKQGQKIICLPYFGHILINLGPKPLITANWVSSEFSSEYQLYKEAKGAVYYAFDDKGTVKWEKNNYYSQIPAIKFVTSNDDMKVFGLKTGVPMYTLMGNDLAKIDFLNNPDKYEYKDAFKYA